MIVLLVLVGLRRRMDRSPFRGLAGFLLCLPLILMPLLGGPSVTLIYFGVHVFFATVLMPTTSAAPAAPASSPSPAVPAPGNTGADWNTYFQFTGRTGLTGDGKTRPPARPRP
ncbi:hypothetical protein ACIBM4_07865 [Streptomyces sp. NPDC050256]|uniref:hypothetical protein n=1 Tax=unclassified Streptomyces TaxID=2593676 RepID=UPI00379A3E91